MWYECLPPMVIITVLTLVPELMSPYIKEFMVGTRYVRSFGNGFECKMLCKDSYKSKNWYIHNGLDSIPDEKPQ